MNIFYIGSSGALSVIPFKKLLASKHIVTVLGIYKPQKSMTKIILLENETLEFLAQQHKIKIVDLAEPIEKIMQQLKRCAIDITLMSCFAKKLHFKLINMPHLTNYFGCYNMHPSLLPKFRGPQPIFWQMKAGAQLGITWHKVSNKFDAGEIAGMRKVTLSRLKNYYQISVKLAQQGAALLFEMLNKIETNNLITLKQNQLQSSYYGFAKPQDFTLDETNTARLACFFMRATENFQMPYSYRFHNNVYKVNHAITYYENDNLKQIKQANSQFYIPFNLGILVVKTLIK